MRKLLCFVLCLTLWPLSAAHADLGFWSANLVGTWRHPSNGQTYRFNSNATYTFTAGKVSHSGYWKIVMPTEKESGGSSEGPVALRLSARRRLDSNGKISKSNRTFRLIVDTVNGEEGQVNRKFYWIDGTKWKRVEK